MPRRRHKPLFQPLAAITHAAVYHVFLATLNV
jgi:hypothetical protein